MPPRTPAGSSKSLFDAVLMEVLSSLLAPEPRRRVLEAATEGAELCLAHAQAALDFVTGRLRDALTAELGSAGAEDLVADMRAILEPLVEQPTPAPELNEPAQNMPTRKPESGQRRRVTAPVRAADPAAEASAADALRQARERPTPAEGIRRLRLAHPASSAFDDVATADLPGDTLEALRGRDTQGPPSHRDSPCVLLSADPTRRNALVADLGEQATILQAAGEAALTALLADPLPAGTIFVIDATTEVSARAFAEHLSKLPRASTVIVWGSEQADLTRPEMAALGFVPSSGEASPRELAELLRGLRAA